MLSGMLPDRLDLRVTSCEQAQEHALIEFDKTGEYILITSDNVIMVYRLLIAGRGGPPHKPGLCEIEAHDSECHTSTFGSMAVEGAVLVCTVTHMAEVWSIDISADNAFVASASLDGEVRVWALSRPKDIETTFWIHTSKGDGDHRIRVSYILCNKKCWKTQIIQ